MKFPIIPMQGKNGTNGHANVSYGTFYQSLVIKRIIKINVIIPKGPNKYHSHPFATENEKVRAIMKNPQINFSLLQNSVGFYLNLQAMQEESTTE